MSGPFFNFPSGGGGSGSAFTSVVINGATSGSLTLTVPAIVSSYTLTFPAAQGAAGTVLENDGSGNLSWVSAGGVSVGTIDSHSAVSNGLQIIGDVLFAQSATATNPGMVNATTQTFAGVKTFNNSIGVGGAPLSTSQGQFTSPTTVTGTLTNSASGTAVTGSGTVFLTEFHIGDSITMNSETQTITAIASDTAMTTTTWTGANSGATATRAAIADVFFYPNGNIQSGGSRASVVSLDTSGGNLILVGNAASTGSTTVTTPRCYIVNYTGNASATTGIPSYFGYRSRGTEASPSAILSGDAQGIFLTGGYDGATFGSGPRIEGFATENWGASAHGSKLTFNTIPNGTTANTVALTLDQDQSATFGGAIKLPSGQGSTGSTTVTFAATNAPSLNTATHPSIWMAVTIGSTVYYFPGWN